MAKIPRPRRPKGQITCPVCGKFFPTVDALQRHADEKHPEGK